MTNVTWNSADKNAAIVLDGTSTIATRSGADTYAGVRGTVGYSTGTYYFEATVPGGSGTEGSVGLANASAPLTEALGYGRSDGIGFYNDGNLYSNAGSASPGGNYFGVRIGFLVNATSRRLWIKNASTWIVGGDPGAGGTGLDISGISGALYPMATIYFSNDSSTLYAEPGTITLGLPAGAALWGDGAVLTPPPTTTTKVYGSVYWH